MAQAELINMKMVLGTTLKIITENGDVGFEWLLILKYESESGDNHFF